MKIQNKKKFRIENVQVYQDEGTYGCAVNGQLLKTWIVRVIGELLKNINKFTRMREPMAAQLMDNYLKRG